MKLLTKDELFTQNAPRHEDVPVGKRVLRIGEITAAGRDVFMSATKPGAPLSEFQARLVVATAVDEAGALVFTEEDIANLRRMPAGILNSLAGAAARLNGIGPQALEEAEKNSGAAQSGGSRSGSRSKSASPSVSSSSA
ncbi:hypothetical protein [Achromobacter marplatensis]|uniref:hypothetical protein n=1 Tax=Achromobacter marplatensis TaxID=470868 RepID=UPI001039110A|nr:hypothetical protein [Achromobacter marplatensis]